MPHGKVTQESVQRAQVELEQFDRHYWKPKDGDNLIRIMPPWDPDGDVWYIRSAQHFNVGPGDKSFACARESDPAADCFLCDLARELAATGDPADKEEADDMRAARRWLINVVDLRAVDRGLQVWPAGINAWRELLSYFADDQWGVDIADPEVGYNVRVNKTGSGKYNTRYAVRVAKDPSVFPYPELLDDLHNPAESVVFSDSDTMRAAYEGLSGNRGAPELPEDDFGEDEPTVAVEAPAGFGDFGDEDEQEPAPPTSGASARATAAPRPPARAAGAVRGTASVPPASGTPRPLPRPVAAASGGDAPVRRVRRVLGQEE